MNLGQLSQTYDRVEFDTESGGDDSRRYFVTLDGKIGVYDIDIDKLVVPTAHDAVKADAHGYRVSLNGKWGLYDHCYDGRLVVKIEYDEIHQSPGLPYDTFVVGQNGKFGMIDAEGNVLIPLEYDLVPDLLVDGGYFYTPYVNEPHFFFVFKGDKQGVYSVPEKRLVVPTEYDCCDPPIEGSDTFRVELDGKHGDFAVDTQTVTWATVDK